MKFCEFSVTDSINSPNGSDSMSIGQLSTTKQTEKIKDACDLPVFFFSRTICDVVVTKQFFRKSKATNGNSDGGN